MWVYLIDILFYNNKDRIESIFTINEIMKIYISLINYLLFFKSFKENKTYSTNNYYFYQDI